MNIILCHGHGGVRTDLASRFARGSVASASLAVAMARGIKGTLLCAHDPTVLTNPRRVSMPSYNDTDYKKNDRQKNIFRVVIV